MPQAPVRPRGWIFILQGLLMMGAALIPLLWCVTRQQILSVLDEPRGIVLLVGVAIALLGMTWKTLSAGSA